MSKALSMNPFELFSYNGPDYFCDREEETKNLLNAIKNRRNIVLTSRRRLGKTNLIYHVQHLLQKEAGQIVIYVDVLETDSDEAFVKKFVEAIIMALDTKENFFKKSLQAFSFLRPKVSIDPYTGSPSIELDFEKGQGIDKSLSTVFGMLSERKENIQIAIDEFQQISNYKTTKIDAALRSFFPTANNVHFIFSGSQQHLLMHLFSAYSSPLFGSSEFLSLDFIDATAYSDFIRRQFNAHDRKISDEAINEILDWTRRHTYYTHFLCNMIFSNGVIDVQQQHVEFTKEQCLKLFEGNYYYFKNILTTNQIKLLEAIGNEGEVTNLYTKAFFAKYKMPPSMITRSLKSLEEKELIFVDKSKSEVRYSMSDVFLGRWLQKNMYN